MRDIDESDFIEKSYLPDSLAEAVIESMGGWADFTESAPDVTRHGAGGGVSGFIYYSETIPFAKQNLKTILAMAKNMADEMGDGSAFQLIAGFNCVDLSPEEVAEAIYNPESENQDEVFNALAWYAVEEVCRAYCDITDE